MCGYTQVHTLMFCVGTHRYAHVLCGYTQVCCFVWVHTGRLRLCVGPHSWLRFCGGTHGLLRVLCGYTQVGSYCVWVHTGRFILCVGTHR